jgi:pimeloyl-ACP methyl ester carboxylesterase
VNLHVETAGDGEPVLFLHGVAGSSATYRWLELDGRKTVRLDFRGHGASDRAPGRYLIGDYVDDAIAVLEAIGPAALAGHSLGGVTAWTVAQQRPELVTAAFLEDPPLFMGAPAEHALNPGVPGFRDLRSTAAAWQAGGASAAEVRLQLAEEVYLEGITCAEVQTPDALAARAYALLHVDVEALDRVIDGSLLAAADTVAPVTRPVLILAADEAVGSAFPAKHEARLAASHPDVAVVRLPGAGHSIHDMTAARDAYTAQLLAFLN